MNTKKWFITGGLVLLVLALVMMLPEVQRKLGWRIDAASAYVQMALDPAGELPTPLPTLQPTAASENLAAQSTPEPTLPAPTAKPEEQLPETEPTQIPAEVILTSPEWEAQDWNNCGPAALAMYMRYFGWDGDQFTISDLIKPVRNDRNVNIEEMDHFIRNNAGWLQTLHRVGGNLDMLKKLIAEGIPVMVEKGEILEESYWPDDDNWFGHYLLLTGYSDDSGAFLSQDSFDHGDKWISYQELEEHWKPFNRIYMLVYLNEQEPAVQRILGEDWNQEQNRQNGLNSAQQEILADQTDAYAWFNLGSNYLYFDRFDEAAEAFDTARILGLPQRFLRYQFGPFFAYFHTNRIDELLALTEFALKLPGDSEEALLWRGWAFFAQGDQVKAAEFFRQAYWRNPSSIDANYALEYLGADPGLPPEE